MNGAQGSSIASNGLQAYWPGMVALRLLRILMLAALLQAPFGMLDNHATAALPTAAANGHHMEGMAAGHCADTGQPAKERPSSSIDCMMACSMLAGVESELAEHPLPAAAPPEAMAPKAIHGLNPEADPPPPRLA